MSENVVTCWTFELNIGQAAAETCHLKGHMLNLKLVFLRQGIIPSSYPNTFIPLTSQTSIIQSSHLFVLKLHC